MIVDTEGIILQTRKFSDTSKIVVIYTKEFGKCSVIAKGAYSAKSKFGGCLELLSHININIYYKNNTNLHLLKSAEIETLHNKISRNTNSLISGLIAAEFINFTQQENAINIQLFDMFAVFLNALNINSDNSYIYCIDFLVGLADNMGFDVNVLPEHFVLDRTNMNNYKTMQNYLSIKELNYNLAETDFINIVHFFEKYFSEQLDKNIIIKSIKLLN